MKNINKKLMAIFVGSFMLLATVAVAVPADVSAQTAGDYQGMSQQDRENLSQQDRERLDNIQNGLRLIMEKYSMTEGAPQISRTDWMNMQGEIYDLFSENEINPATAMKYMFGQKMEKN